MKTSETHSKTIENWFENKIVKQIKEIIYPEYPNSIYYVHKDYVNKNDTDKIYMEYNKNTKNLYIDNNKIWFFLEYNYSHRYNKIEEMIKYLVKKYLNLCDICETYDQYNRVIAWSFKPPIDDTGRVYILNYKT